MLENQKNKSINVTNNDLILKGSDKNNAKKLNFNIIEIIKIIQLKNKI